MNLSSLYLSFSGRINRQPWWLGLLALAVVHVVILLGIFAVIGPGAVPIDPNDQAAAMVTLSKIMIPAVVLWLIVLYPTLAIYTKRWHDRGKSGWGTLIALVPIIGGIWALVELGFLRGTAGSNRYGPDPLDA